jgi:hypothetical protein
VFVMLILLLGRTRPDAKIRGVEGEGCATSATDVSRHRMEPPKTGDYLSLLDLLVPVRLTPV